MEIFKLYTQTIISIRPLSFEESNNEYYDPELDKVYRKYIKDNSNPLTEQGQQNTGDKSNSFDELSIDKYILYTSFLRSIDF